MWKYREQARLRPCCRPLTAHPAPLTGPRRRRRSSYAGREDVLRRAEGARACHVVARAMSGMSVVSWPWTGAAFRVERHGNSCTPSLDTGRRDSCTPSSRGRVVGLPRFFSRRRPGGPCCVFKAHGRKDAGSTRGSAMHSLFFPAVEACRRGDADMQSRAVPTQRHACLGFSVSSIL